MDLTRISACNYAVRSEPLDAAFRIIADCGFLKVDLWGGPPNYSNDPEECDVAALRQQAGQYGLQIANLGTYPGRRFFTDGADSEWLEMTRAIDNAAYLGARSIRVCPGHGEDPAMVSDLIPFFGRAAGYAQDKGVFLGMENHKGSIAGNPDVIMKLVSAVDSPFFGILYEPANLMACKVNYKDAYEAFRGCVTHVHVKDSRWIDGQYERTMLGEGDIDYEWVTTTLENDGYTGDYALEFEIEKTVPIEDGLPTWLESFRAL